MTDTLNIESDANSSRKLVVLRSEMESMFSKIDTIDTSITVEDPEWVGELEEDKVKTKWDTFKSIFKKSKTFNMNSGVSFDSRMIISRDFVLNVDEHAESPRFGDVQEPFESYVSDLKPTRSIKHKYQVISLVSRKFQLNTPKFEDMGKGSFAFFWEQFKNNFT
ncbi:hypothetical protein KDRO_E07380 [Kluyveromyces lactis]|nr:hypothetical protein KDRO_E07380 [Kluyveromyces lactis]